MGEHDKRTEASTAQVSSFERIEQLQEVLTSLPSANTSITFKVLKVRISDESAQKCTFRSRMATSRKGKASNHPRLAREIKESGVLVEVRVRTVEN